VLADGAAPHDRDVIRPLRAEIAAAFDQRIVIPTGDQNRKSGLSQLVTHGIPRIGRDVLFLPQVSPDRDELGAPLPRGRKAAAKSLEQLVPAASCHVERKAHERPVEVNVSEVQDAHRIRIADAYVADELTVVTPLSLQHAAAARRPLGRVTGADRSPLSLVTPRMNSASPIGTRFSSEPEKTIDLSTARVGRRHGIGGAARGSANRVRVSERLLHAEDPADPNAEAFGFEDHAEGGGCESNGRQEAGFDRFPGDVC
jgi:hypothetical protein